MTQEDFLTAYKVVLSMTRNRTAGVFITKEIVTNAIGIMIAGSVRMHGLDKSALETDIAAVATASRDAYDKLVALEQTRSVTTDKR